MSEIPRSLEEPRRKRVRLPRENYLGQRQYFITICCHQREPVFRNASRATRLVTLVREVSAHRGFLIHAYCVMPDHLHLLAEGSDTASDLVDLVRVVKLRSSFEERLLSGRQLWQRSFYEHILRPKDSMDSVAWYVWMNPVRKGLCKEPEDYAFSGSFTMDWKRLRSRRHVWVPPWKGIVHQGTGIGPI